MITVPAAAAVVIFAVLGAVCGYAWGLRVRLQARDRDDTAREQRP